MGGCSLIFIPNICFVEGNIMAESKKTPVKKGARSKSAVVVDPEDHFNVGEYIERTEYIDFMHIAVDNPTSEKTFGQVREINTRHVAELVDSFQHNPPTELELTVYQDPGKDMFYISHISLHCFSHSQQAVLRPQWSTPFLCCPRADGVLDQGQAGGSPVSEIFPMPRCQAGHSTGYQATHCRP